MLKYKLFIITCFLLELSISKVENDDSDYSYKDYQSEEKKVALAFIHKIKESSVKFMLYTRNHRNSFHLLQLENKRSILNSGFDPKKKTKIVIHGWMNGYKSIFSASVKDAYLKHSDVNVIVVDWSQQSHENYLFARLDVPQVAGVVAKMIDLLVKEFGMQRSMVHLIGHSLGAHVSGIAGLKVSTGKVSRITGLDPAQPLFFLTLFKNGRLGPDSADFVDVIHSCGKLLGFEAALGQVDFYPNGGTYKQPGCGLDLDGHCSHARSYEYFVESIKSNKFMAVKCDNWRSFLQKKCNSAAVPMGEHTPSTARGKYYLTTNSEAPFARGSFGYPDYRLRLKIFQEENNP